MGLNRRIYRWVLNLINSKLFNNSALMIYAIIFSQKPKVTGCHYKMYK